MAKDPGKTKIYSLFFYQNYSPIDQYHLPYFTKYRLKPLSYSPYLSERFNLISGQVLPLENLYLITKRKRNLLEPRTSPFFVNNRFINAQTPGDFSLSPGSKHPEAKPDKFINKTLPVPGTLPVRYHEKPTENGILPIPTHFYQLDFKEKLLTITVFLFILAALTIFFLVLSSRLFKIYSSGKTKKLQKKYELLLMEILFTEEEEDPEEENRKLKAFVTNYNLNNSFNRRVLVSEIIRLHKNFSGTLAQNLEKFFLGLHLEKDSFSKLSSWHWYLKAQGISELAQMNVKPAVSSILKYIEHSNEMLRMEAQLAVLKLSEENILDFLYQLKSSLTDWHQVNLQQVLTSKDREQIPEFSNWLQSANPSVLEFSIKMAGLYNQVNAIPQLIRLIKHKDTKIKLAAVQALQKLDASEALVKLEEVYHQETNKELKLTIIKTLESIGYTNLTFFEKELNSPDFDISLASAKAIMHLQTSGREYFLELLKKADERLCSIIHHVLDTRI